MQRPRRYDPCFSSTDPPYYDNIGYSDLSDFFYVWLRRTFAHDHPELLSTMLVPKAEELVANPYRHEGKRAPRSSSRTASERSSPEPGSPPVADYPITV